MDDFFSFSRSTPGPPRRAAASPSRSTCDSRAPATLTRETRASAGSRRRGSPRTSIRRCAAGAARLGAALHGCERAQVSVVAAESRGRDVAAARVGERWRRSPPPPLTCRPSRPLRDAHGGGATRGGARLPQGAGRCAPATRQAPRNRRIDGGAAAAETAAFEGHGGDGGVGGRDVIGGEGSEGSEGSKGRAAPPSESSARRSSRAYRMFTRRSFVRQSLVKHRSGPDRSRGGESSGSSRGSARRLFSLSRSLSPSRRAPRAAGQ